MFTAANILIHEEGRLEICDFGVAGVLQSQRDKRSTWIGTPHWMPPEMFATRGEAHKYGSEVSFLVSSHSGDLLTS
jgi:serine/threonine protein kinase